MMVRTVKRRLGTRGQGDAHDITRTVASAVAETGVRHGLVTVAVIGSTAGLTTIEFEPGALSDLNGLLDRLAPHDGEYRHHLMWGDDNGSSHVRAALIGSSLTLPLVEGALALGTWQQIALLEFDTRARERELVIQVLGE
jgi:secondary thiamine-phosphate synthase enzyme